MYKKGEGVKQDYGRAVEWYRRAAEQGYADAQYNLSVMYGTGRGVVQDYVTARGALLRGPMGAIKVESGLIRWNP